MFLLRIDLHPFDAIATRGSDLNVYRSLEEHHLRVLRFEIEKLLLPDLYHQGLLCRVVVLRNTKYRMTHLVEPLIKKPVQWLAGSLFDGNSKLSGLHRLVRVLCQVMIDRSPPVILSQVSAQHVQYGAAARIGISIKNSVGVSIVFRYDGPPLTAGPGLIVGFLVRFHVEIQKVVVSQMMLVPHGLEVGRKTFIEPDVGPGAASQIVAKPLVR